MAKVRDTSSSTCSPNAAAGQPARGVHGRTRIDSEHDAGARARDGLLARRCSSCRRRQGGDVRIRIFTPGSSCPSPGIRSSGRRSCSARRSSAQTIEIETGSGIVPVELERDESGADRLRPHGAAGPDDVEVSRCRLLSSPRSASDGSALPVERYDNGCPHIFVALATEDEVAALTPDMAALARRRCRVASTALPAPASGGRLAMFLPAAGVGEDAATGSAAGPLACHLCRHGLVDVGRRRSHLAGGRARPSLDALCARRRQPEADRSRRGRRAGGHRGAWRVPAWLTTA